MRKISEIKFDIEMNIREVTQLLSQQNSIDERMTALDRRRGYLEKELKEVSAVTNL